MKKKFYKIVSVFLALNILIDGIYPTVTYALTSGPSQPEVQGFTPIGTSDMVNLYSGDFNYNIPLMDVGGYPLNISYQSGISMDQEASWVGLGWSLNPGVINRNMRSIPDDFMGDKIVKEFNIKENKTFGVKFYPDGEVLGKNLTKALSKFNIGAGLTYNNYTGYGFSMSMDLKTASLGPNKGSATGHLGLSAGSDDGVGISPSLSFSKLATEATSNDLRPSARVGLSYNSRGGLQALTLSTQIVRGTENVGVRALGSNGSSISFSSPTYTPQVGHSMLNRNLSLSVTLGSEVAGGHPSGRLEGSFSGQFLLRRVEEFSSYGYMHSELATDDKAMMDFNREKDGSFTQHTPALPLTNLTYDLYSVSGQGIGGMYRAHRSDIGIVHDVKTTSISAGANFPGVETGVGAIGHLGANVSVNQSNSTSGKWKKNNDAEKVLGFKGSNGDRLYEPYYFTKVGEKTAETDEAFFNGIGGFSAVSVALDDSTEDVPTRNEYDMDGGKLSMSVATRKKRVSRNEVISLLTAKEAETYGSTSKLENYTINDFAVKGNGSTTPVLQPKELINRYEGVYKPHHTSEITTYRNDGAKYVYGIPAYNTVQEDATFAIGEPRFQGSDKANGVVRYNYDDQTILNSMGVDNYYEKSIMPAYAHSYLLTEILSADYVDLKGDGPTDDDFGTYTKINYSKLESTFNWRVPFDAFKANYNEGFKSVPYDDKGSYIYGEKDIWYIHSIETKNYVAEFTLANRDDGFGVAGRMGGIGLDVPLKSLEKITLYSKQDLLRSNHNVNNQNLPVPAPDPTPIKTVHFTYDYSLCLKVDNNKNKLTQPSNNGKLTLKSIYFTYGNSKKGKLSPYEFSYGAANTPENPNYNLKGYDRWGNYKPNSASATGMSTAEYPYVEQKDISNQYAAAWHMKSIKLPSGGEIQMEFEADDYAYVQDKKAMQMFEVIGACKDVPKLATDGTSKLYGGVLAQSNSYLIFKLQNNTTAADIDAYFKEKDGTRMPLLYFKFLVDLGGFDNGKKYEYVPGYARVLDYGTLENDSSYGWVKLAEPPINDKKPSGNPVNPISQAAWNFTRLYLPRLAHGYPANPSEPGVLQIVKAMVVTLKSIANIFNGFYNKMRLERKAQEFDANKSFIRLYNPNNAKKGGGSRVHTITMHDNWTALSGETESSFYGQQYEYKTINEYGEKISSGVAAYEPMLGGDENPFKQPVFFEEKHLLAASDDFYQEKPYGESFFPGASVGYSKVTVTSILPTGKEIVKASKTGSVVSEFYTAKDFPTITRQTSINPVRKKANPLLKLLKIKVTDYMTASQGYVVELNDMAGKEKATWVYQEGKKEPISGVEYKYKTSQQAVPITSVNKPIRVESLDNTMLVMSKDGTVAEKMVGVEYDFVTDMREQKTVNRTAGFGGNLETFLIAILPGVIPSVFPSYSQERVRFRSVVATKVINRYGILEETIAHDLGSIVSTKNKMLDAETGTVLLTETKNHFDDPIYNFTYPAYWAYDRMGPAYQNIGVVLAGDDATISKYLVPGDELELFEFPYENLERVWVKNANPFTAYTKDGVVYTDFSGKFIKVLRSGRRNQQSASVGSFTSLNTPLVYQNNGKVPVGFAVNKGTNIINASATEFTEYAKFFCDCERMNARVNPYLKGVMGNWRPKRSWVYLTGRNQERLNDNTAVRKDGTYTSFSPFWTVGGAGINYPNDWARNSDGWQFTSEVTVYSPFGSELENMDALRRFSAATYGYNNSVPTAVSSNAQYREIGFDGFEDYGFGNCSNDHFNFRSNSANVDETKSHSGRRSIKVEPNGSIELIKSLFPCRDIGG